jgi:hypothetical protein
MEPLLLFQLYPLSKVKIIILERIAYVISTMIVYDIACVCWFHGEFLGSTHDSQVFTNSKLWTNSNDLIYVMESIC